jgi:hypothetical protein
MPEEEFEKSGEEDQSDEFEVDDKKIKLEEIDVDSLDSDEDEETFYEDDNF